MNIALRHTEVVACLVNIDGHRKRIGIRNTDIFARKTNHASCDIQRIVPALKHAKRPIHGSVGIGIAHRLVERGNQIVMLLAALVVEKRFAADTLCNLLVRNRDAVRADGSVQNRHLKRVERRARIPVGKLGDGANLLLAHLDMVLPEALLRIQGMRQKSDDIILGERLKHKHLAP